MSDLYVKCPKTGKQYDLNQINEVYRSMDLWGTVIYFECECGGRHDSYLSKKL